MCAGVQPSVKETLSLALVSTSL